MEGPRKGTPKLLIPRETMFAKAPSAPRQRRAEPRSPQQTLTAVEVTAATAVVIDGKFTPKLAVLANKVKLLAKELPVLLVSSEPESNAPPPANVDVVAYVESPDAFVHALKLVLQLTLPYEKAVPA